MFMSLTQSQPPGLNSSITNILSEAGVKLTDSHCSKYRLSFSQGTAKGIQQLIQVSSQALVPCIFGSDRLCVFNGMYKTLTGRLHRQVSFIYCSLMQ